MSAPLPAPSSVSGLHIVQVVHAAGRLDEKGGVGPAVAVTMIPYPTVVGKGAGRLTVEGVTVARVSHGGSCTGSCDGADMEVN